MSSFGISVIVFVCVFGSAVLGGVFRDICPSTI